jgi:ABC-2 type transport system ATP-binding protein
MSGPDSEHVILTEKLTKTYGRNRGIVALDLDIHKGEVFGFLGPNGAGKTTTIRTMLDLLHPTSGRALLFGMDSRRDSVAIRARLGNLPGEFALEDRLTGEELLRFFGRLRGSTDLRYARVLAERLDADLSRPLRQLSRGNKQKIGLIQAMFHRPDLLILDEPTGGLDPLVQEEFVKLMDEWRAEGRSVLLSSHVLSEVERVCDRVGIIREGELAALETTESLISKRFRRMKLTFAQPVDPAPFAALPGTSDVSSIGSTVSLVVRSGLDSVIKLAARYVLVDLDFERPSLEEVFLTYYGTSRGDSPAAAPAAAPVAGRQTGVAAAAGQGGVAPAEDGGAR